MELPEGFSNVRYIFTNAAVEDPMGFSLGCQGDIGMDAGEIASNARTAFNTNFAYESSALLSGWRFEGCTATTTVGGLPTIGESLGAVVGSQAAPGAVAHTAILIRKNTAAGGRKNRGRMFFPPFALPETMVGVGGELNPTTLTSMQTTLNLWHTAMVAALIPPWLLHGDPADTPTPITGFSVQARAATQRRRIR